MRKNVIQYFKYNYFKVYLILIFSKPFLVSDSNLNITNTIVTSQYLLVCNYESGNHYISMH